MSLHIQKNDTVLVLKGKEAGKRGKVLKVYSSDQRAVVEKVNVMKKHTRPNPRQGVKGGIAEREAPLHISNLMVVCPECDRPGRPRHETLEDGTRVRVCRKCGGNF
jgi:large subunit ribosomal protein L24